MTRKEEIDGLTGLSNMYAFRKYAQEIMDDKHKRRHELAIIYFDVENFKIYNAKYGFEAGDRFLQNLAKNLKKVFGELMVSRFSDDHFVTICYYKSLEMRIEDLQRRIVGYNLDAEIGLHAGIYIIDQNDTDISMACDRARMACNSIKKNYEHIYRFYDDEIGEEINLRQYIIHHVGDAVLKGHIQIYYQPVVRVISGRVCGFEALARWVDPENGFLMPGDFIPILEEAHLIYKLDAYVIRKVCEDIRDFTEKGRKPLPVSVNLSRTDFHQRDMYHIVNEAVTLNDIQKRMIHIEITESALDEDFDVLKGTVEKFRRGGYQVWMDDFGSGYSSLNLLKDLEFDVLKFDMRFLQDFGSKPKETAIWENVINMAEEIGIQTLAEGVETLEAWDFLKRVGCEKAQGYFFGRPMSKEEIFDYLEEAGAANSGKKQFEDEYNAIPEGIHYSERELITLSKEEAEEPEESPHMDSSLTDNSEMFTKLAARGFASLLEYSSYSQFQKYSFFIVADITNDRLTDLHLSMSRAIYDKVYSEGESYQAMIDEIVKNTVISDEQIDVANFFSRDRLMLAFRSGIINDDLEFHRIPNKKIAPRWTHTIYQMEEKQGKVLAYFLSFDIDEYRRSRDLVRQMAERDSLTGLYNRHTAIPLIRNSLYRHQNGKAAIIMLDVDHFRDINENYGHIAGDEVLRRLAARIDSVFGQDGIVCHLYQNTFLIFLEKTSLQDVEKRVGDFCNFDFNVRFQGETISFTISCGYVIHPDDGRGYHDLYRKADAAMCSAKEAGGGCAMRFKDK